MILLLLYACGPRAQKVEKTLENEVEVVINHLEPYKLFDPEGNLIRETAFPKDAYALYPLDNNKDIVYWRKYATPEADHFNDHFGLSGPGLEGIRVLDLCRWPNQQSTESGETD